MPGCETDGPIYGPMAGKGLNRSLFTLPTFEFKDKFKTKGAKEGDKHKPYYFIRDNFSSENPPLAFLKFSGQIVNREYVLDP